MVKKKRPEETDIADLIIKGMQEKKALDIVKIDFSGVQNGICDTFVICHGTSKTHVEAIADSVDSEVKKNTGANPWHKEGFQNGEWILLDYLNVVAHIFQENIREFYQLENLWADAEISRIDQV